MIVFTEPKPMEELAFMRDGREVRVKLTAAMLSNHGVAIMTAAEAGVGLAVAPSFLAHAGVAVGRLEPVLIDWALREYRLFAVYPHRRFLSPKVRVFIEALREAYGEGSNDPWWVAPAFAANTKTRNRKSR
jgi:DNA-binding transcriptional LysR family regulator